MTPSLAAAGATAAGGPARGWREGLRRLAVVPLLAAYLAAPGWVLLLAPELPTWLRFALVALTVLAVARPHWSPAVLIGLVPLLPIWPTLVPDVPDGIVHLVVATQAIPWMVYRLLGRRAERSSMAAGWSLFVAVATVSLLVAFTPEPWRGVDLPHVWRLIRNDVPAYMFGVEHLMAVSGIPVWTVLADGLLCALIVSWATTRGTRESTLRAAATAAVLTAVFGMWQAVTGLGLQTAWQIFDAGITRINATYIDPNALAAFYALVAPVLGRTRDALVRLAACGVGRGRGARAGGRGDDGGSRRPGRARGGVAVHGVDRDCVTASTRSTPRSSFAAISAERSARRCWCRSSRCSVS